MLTPDKDALRKDPLPLREQLRQAGADIRRDNAIRCPFHDDSHPSAGIYADEHGIYRFKCFTCDLNLDVYDLQARAQNKTPADILREIKAMQTEPKWTMPPADRKPAVYPTLEAAKASYGNIESEFVYVDTGGAPVLYVERMIGEDGKKTFRQITPVDGGFIRLAPAESLPLYRLDRIKEATSVIFVEGEKCVHAVENAGHVATTNACGAGSSDKVDLAPLAGKTVYLWPDNDETGVGLMRKIAGRLEELHPPVNLFWIEPDGLDLPPKGDAVEFLELHGGGSPESAVAALLECAEPMGGAAELQQQIDQIITGEKAVVDFPWRILSELTNAMHPGTITVLCGDPGSTKSFVLLEALAYWHEQAVPCCVFELEEDRNYHLLRALAQREYNSFLTNYRWIKENAADARAAMQRHNHFINSFSRCITDAPEEVMTLPKLLEWIGRRAAQGNRIIAVDPVTICPVDKPWIEDSDFLQKAKKIVRQHDCSLLLVTHPRKGSKGVGLHDLAGSAAYARFAQTIVWIRAHPDPREETVECFFGKRKAKFNRSIQICKTRNSYGSGMEVAFQFSGGTLRSVEEGIVLGAEKQGKLQTQKSNEIQPVDEKTEF